MEVENDVLPECASTKVMIKDHSSCLTMQGGVRIIACYAVISEVLYYPKEQSGDPNEINWRACQLNCQLKVASDLRLRC